MFYLEAFGLFLALMDFTGLSRYLETAADGIRESLRVKISEHTFFDIRGKIRVMLDDDQSTYESLVSILTALTIVFIFIFIGELVFDYFTQFVFAPIVGISLIATSVVIGILTISNLSFAVISVLWTILHILNMPRAGIVGSIGLVVAIVSFTFGHLLGG